MQDLTLVGVHDDGEHLVLAAPDGTRFRLPADDGLRLAARRAARAPDDVAAGTPPTPREIQARLRAGEDAAEIAAATGTTEERVRRYEVPVLAERAHVAERARALPVRWRDGSGRSPELEDLVAERLSGRGVESAPTWDAWRREDGAWLVQAVFTAGARGRRATWALDLQRASLEALDDESRWLSSVDAEATSSPAGPAGPDEVPRLAAVREEVYDVDDAGTTRRAGGVPVPVDLAARRAGGGREAGDGGPAGAQGSGDGSGDGSGRDAGEGAEQDRRERVSRTSDLLEHLRGRRGRRQPLADPDDEEVEALTWAELEALTARVDGTGPVEGGDEDEPGREDPWDAAGEPPAAHPPASRPEEAVDDEVLGGEVPDGEVPDGEAADAPTDGPSSEAGSTAEAPRARRRRRRASGTRADADGVPGQEELLPVLERPEDPSAGGAGGSGATDEDAGDASDEDAHDASDDDDRSRRRARAAPTGRRGTRPGVPSWDDIVFGQRRD